ncbi:hypothetical protein [Subtercola vilae]|uniref:hypothetical protein n=1 Tax=Subtercola vilae TaxID=2056433 RepID=UPI0013756466|nr:hypothetical protein [Subtercola vilae]
MPLSPPRHGRAPEDDVDPPAPARPRLSSKRWSSLTKVTTAGIFVSATVLGLQLAVEAPGTTPLTVAVGSSAVPAAGSAAADAVDAADAEAIAAAAADAGATAAAAAAATATADAAGRSGSGHEPDDLTDHRSNAPGRGPALPPATS